MTGGAKVYLTGNLLKSLLYEGYKVFDFYEIEKNGLDSLKKPLDDIDAERNVGLYNYTRCNGQPIIEGWRRVYEY